MSDLPSRDAIVATAGESIARGSKSFAAASRLFDRRTRERAWLLYAWCRKCDDIADGQDHGHGMTIVEDAPARLIRLSAMTDAALAGDWVGDPAFDALRIVAAETRMPKRFRARPDRRLRARRRGMAAAQRGRPVHILLSCRRRGRLHDGGGDGGCHRTTEATLDRACDLGMAFQLANIARDIEEDDRVGRCYLPEEWLVEMDIPPGQHMKPPFRQRLAVLAKRLATRAASVRGKRARGNAGAAVSIGLGGAGGGGHLWRDRARSRRARRTGLGPPRLDIGHGENRDDRAGRTRGSAAPDALPAGAARPRSVATAALTAAAGVQPSSGSPG